MTALRDAGTLDDTLVIVTSDHGEALGEHGEDVHGYFVYEATLRVPLVIRGPGVKAGTRMEALARTIDLYPTILEMTKLGVTPSSGQSLVPVLQGRTRAAAGGGRWVDAPSFAESLVPLLHYGWSDLRAVRDGRWKYILAPRHELYDLQNDPGELHDLSASEPAKAAAMRSAIEATLRTEQITARSDTARAGIPPEVLERLGALGYVGPGASPVSPKSAGSGRTKAEDPKDKLAEYKALSVAMQEALVALRGGRHAQALEHLRTVSRRGVDSFEVHYYAGRALAGLARWREAAAEYEKASAKLPGDVASVRGLGESRVAMGDRAGASRAFEKLVLLAPRDAVARLQLGEAYRDQARYAEAEREIKEALKLDPAPARYLEFAGNGAGRRREDGGGGAGVRGGRHARAEQRSLHLQPQPRSRAARTT